MKLLRAMLIVIVGACCLSLLNPRLIANPPKDYENLGKQVANHFQQCFLTSGLGALVNEKDLSYLRAYSVSDRRKLTLEQGKRLAADMLKMTLDLALCNPIYECHLQAMYADGVRCSGDPDHIGPEQFGFKVGFWDENVERLPYPYLAQIRAAGGKVYFYYTDPKTQGLLEPATEVLSYKELLEWRKTY